MSAPLVNIHTHRTLNDSEKGIQSFFIQEMDINTELPDTFSTGIHPWHLSKIDWKKQVTTLEHIIRNSQMVAVGECGLDRHIPTNFDMQREAFLVQLKLAEEYQKPMILHNVRAFSDFMTILKQEQPKIPLLFHGFNGNKDIMQKLLSYNVYFSLGKDILGENTKATRIINEIPISRLFLETDEWDGTIESIYQRAADLMNKDLLDLRNQLYYTFKSLFL